jgi:hypothetical protein
VMMRGGRANTFMNEKNALLCWGASFSTSHLDILSKLNIKNTDYLERNALIG